MITVPASYYNYTLVIMININDIGVQTFILRMARSNAEIQAVQFLNGPKAVTSDFIGYST